MPKRPDRLDRRLEKLDLKLGKPQRGTDRQMDEKKSSVFYKTLSPLFQKTEKKKEKERKKVKKNMKNINQNTSDKLS